LQFNDFSDDVGCDYFGKLAKGEELNLIFSKYCNPDYGWFFQFMGGDSEPN
jgi:hypothetical protein